MTKTVSQVLKDKYQIITRPGRSARCPYCGKQTFRAHRSDSFGRCFNPECNRAISVDAQDDQIKMVDAVLSSAHSCLPAGTL